ncbi:MAG: hypothetical protein HYT93_01675 [Parcubacteria group bacterium]|nr:hypothetical protein [Parcubacteria group bacterium]
MSVRLSERPVTLHEAMDLIAAYIKKSGKKWKIPLVEEIEECTKGKKEYFKESIWALDSSRFWRTFCPASGEMSPGLDFTFYAPVEDGPLAHVYLVQHEFSKR